MQLGSVETALSVLFSPDFSPETPETLGREMVKCVTRGLVKAAPEIRLVPQKEFYQAIFGIQPDEVLLRADTIGVLFARRDIKQRVVQIGLTHLILVGGATRRDSESGAVPPGYLTGLGAAWTHGKRSTRLTASIFELAGGAEVAEVQASAEGRQFVLILPLVLGWYPATESPSCDALGAEVARAIRGKSRDGKH